MNIFRQSVILLRIAIVLAVALLPAACGGANAPSGNAPSAPGGEASSLPGEAGDLSFGNSSLSFVQGYGILGT